MLLSLNHKFNYTMKKTLFSLLLLCFCSFSLSAQNIDLKGQWSFQTDPNDVGVEQGWFNKTLDDTLFLPGSTSSNGKGDDITVDTKWTGSVIDRSWYTDDKYAKYREKDNLKTVFWLQPIKAYLGAAWYSTDFSIDQAQADKQLQLILERPHWETTVWVDGVEVGMDNSLSTAHVYELPALKAGNHKLAIRVDNRMKNINVGENAHSISDHTQSNWNGIVGEIALVPRSQVFIENIKTYPNLDKKEVRVLVDIKNQTKESVPVTLDLSASSLFSPKLHKVQPLEVENSIAPGKQTIELIYPMGDDFYTWDEYSPIPYQLDASLKSSVGSDKFDTQFGMIKLERNNRQFIVNDKPVFLRGTLDCATFPLTGYPPTDVAEWKRIFNAVKAHGLNHVRYHSWCPPKAAFIAADELGVYLQVEGAGWTTVGGGNDFDKWIYQESERILDQYGNHPSLILYTYGNEPNGGNMDRFLGDLVTHLKEYDPRHFYTSGAGWPEIPENEFNNAMYARLYVWGDGLNSFNNKNKPSTDFDWNETAHKFDIPYVSHEIGQWCVYPNFKEIDKYQGVLKARNFEVFQETLKESGIEHLADSFLLASGKHQAQAYKEDIEAALRTKDFGGFQLLGLNDFPGQGTALVGVLDAFWEEKGYITPEEFKQFSGQTVPLARLSKMVFTNKEPLVAKVEAAHYGPTELKGVVPTWTVSTIDGQVIESGNLKKQNIGRGNCISLGEINASLRNINKPTELKLTVNILDNTNSWDVWVYPTEKQALKNTVHITSILDKETLKVLKKGGTVLYSPKKDELKPEYGGNIVMGYSPIFWNTAWTRQAQPPHMMGILANPEHPLFELFPTKYYTSSQWWPLLMNSNTFYLSPLKTTAEPLVRVIDDWFSNQSLGLIIEGKIGKGKIVVSGADLINTNDNIEVEQLKYALLSYMESDAFNPKDELDIKVLKDMFKTKK